MTQQLSTDRAAALLCLIPAVLSLVIVLHHPVLHEVDRQSTAAMVAGISRIAASNAAFHGTILLFMGAQALGLYSFAERLGFSRLTVRAGALFYGIATILLFVPGIIDGFVTPLLGARCTTEPSSCITLAGSLSFEWAAIQAFTRVALMMQALGLLCWSLALASEDGWRRLSGVGGTLLAVAPLVLLSGTARSIGPSRLAEIIVFEALWTIAAAVMLWNGSIVRTTDRLGKPQGAD